MYGNMAANDGGPRSQEVGQEPWLVEKSQVCEIGENKFSLVYVKDMQMLSVFVCSD